MAYALPANSRMAYDLDGSDVVVYDSSDGTLTALSSANVEFLNNETTQLIVQLSGTINANGAPQPSFIAFIFPELRDVVSYYIGTYLYTVYGFSEGPIKVSTDTTNGLDGTWTTATTAWVKSYSTFRDSYRNEISGLGGASSIKGIRFEYAESATGFAGYDAGVHSLHLYGNISTTADRLAFWHPTADVALSATDLDFGDITRSSNYTKTFRVKNLSLTLTATDIDISRNALSNGTPTVTGKLSLSDDGSTFSNSIGIYSLAPLEISNVITLKRSVAIDSLLSVQSARLVASAASWA